MTGNVPAGISIDAVTSLLVEVAEAEVLPRFRRLRADEIGDKGGDDLVTVADRTVERILSDRLTNLLPGSRCIGEEACHADPRLLDSLDSGWVWLIDPIDGTRNFVEGDEDFAVMTALLRNGETVASWMHAPAAGWTACAETGSGAWLDGSRVGSIPPTNQPGLVYTRFLPPEVAPCVEEFGQRCQSTPRGVGSAGCEYRRLVTGEIAYVLFWRTLPWDHAPGSHFVEQAGGAVRRLDGTPYRASSDDVGLLAAPSDAGWREVAEVLNDCFGSDRTGDT